MTLYPARVRSLVLSGAIILCHSLGWGQLSQSHQVLDLGQRIEGAEATAILTLRNQGLVPIRLLRIDAPCAVRVLRSPRGLVPPGSRAVIEFAIPTAGRLGLHDHQIILHHSGIDLPLRVQLRADVQRRSQPVFVGSDTLGPLVFSSLRESLKGLVRPSGTPREFSVRVMNIGSTRVALFDSLFGAFELVPARQVLDAGQATQLLFRYRPGKWLGLPDSLHIGDSRWRGFEHQVLLFTDAPSLSRVAIQVTGVFDPGAMSDQPTSFGLESDAELVCPQPEVRLPGLSRPTTVSYRIFNRGAAPLRLRALSTRIEGLQLVRLDSLIAPHSEGNVVLAFSPGALPPGFNLPLARTIPLATSDPRRRLFILTLRFAGTIIPGLGNKQHNALQ